MQMIAKAMTDDYDADLTEVDAPRFSALENKCTEDFNPTFTDCLNEPLFLDESQRPKTLKAAYSLFLRHSFHSISWEDVAREAELPVEVVRYWFDTKLEILKDVILLEQQKFKAKIKLWIKGDLSPREKLRRYLRTLLLRAQEMPLLTLVLREDPEIYYGLTREYDDLKQQLQPISAEILAELLDQAAAPHRWPAEDLLMRGQLLLEFSNIMSVYLRDPSPSGIARKNFTKILSDLLIDGIDGCPEFGSVP